MGFFDQPGVDGRRKSNPLRDPSNSPPKSPALQLWRHVTADDAALVAGALPDVSRGGVNYKSYLGGVVHVVPRSGPSIDDDPGGTSLVAVTLLEWNPALEAFVDAGTVVGTTAAGATESFTFPALERRVYFRVTGLQPGESATLYVAANDQVE